MGVSVINVEAYLFFFGFFRPDLSLGVYRKRCFLVVLCCQIVRRLNSDIAIKRLLHQQVKNQVSFNTLPCREVCTYNNFQWCGYFWGPCVSYFKTDEFSVRVTKIASRICVSWTHNETFWFLPLFYVSEITILSKVHKPDNFESQSSLKLSFTSTQGLHSNSIGFKNFLESSSPDIFV